MYQYLLTRAKCFASIVLLPEHFRIGSKKMRFEDGERTVLALNDHIRLKNIPSEAHQSG